MYSANWIESTTSIVISLDKAHGDMRDPKVDEKTFFAVIPGYLLNKISNEIPLTIKTQEKDMKYKEVLFMFKN